MTERRRSLVLGVLGQDGSYLAEHLLARDYEVHGVMRGHGRVLQSHIRGLLRHTEGDDPRLRLYSADVSDLGGLLHLIQAARPQEIYNLAAQTHVGHSFDAPFGTGMSTGMGAVSVLEAARLSGLDCKIFQACSSEMFGNTPAPQNESSEVTPVSPYGASKAFAYWMGRLYRQSYGMFVSNGIMFNHESPRRGEDFVTRKITLAVARISMGDRVPLRMGRLDSVRDWGYAPDYVDAMWRMMQRDSPSDYVIATGVGRTITEFLSLAFESRALDWREFVIIDSDLFRPTEVMRLIGDSSKAAGELGWAPTVDVPELASIMVEADLKQWRESN